MKDCAYITINGMKIWYASWECSSILIIKNFYAQCNTDSGNNSVI